MNSALKAYLAGGGVGLLAAAAFMIRNGGVPGGNIAIYESLPLLAITALRITATACPTPVSSPATRNKGVK
jgi:uncharacterized membrane protein (UPF0136 family)